MKHLVAALYKFVSLPDYESLKPALLQACLDNEVKGSILLASEGVNGTIAGPENGVHAVLAHLRADERLADLVHKESFASKSPFVRAKVHLKREIVTMGVPPWTPRRGWVPTSNQRTGILDPRPGRRVDRYTQ